MDLPTVSFTEALLIEACVLTFVFYLLFRLSSRRVSGVTFAIFRRALLFRGFFASGHVVLIASFMLITMYSLLLGHRPWMYFLWLSLAVAYIIFGNNRETSNVKNLLVVVMVSLLLPITIMANNNFFCFSGDQGVFLKRGLEIVNTGTWQQYEMARYYESFPFLATLLASITIVTGFSENTYVFLIPVASLLLALTVYHLSRRLGGSEKVAFIAPFVTMSIPALTFLPITHYLSIVFGFTCLYLVIKGSTINLEVPFYL